MINRKIVFLSFLLGFGSIFSMAELKKEILEQTKQTAPKQVHFAIDPLYVKKNKRASKKKRTRSVRFVGLQAKSRNKKD